MFRGGRQGFQVGQAPSGPTVIRPLNMTDSDLTKYDWRRQLGDGGSGVYIRPRGMWMSVVSDRIVRAAPTYQQIYKFNNVLNIAAPYNI